MTLEGERIREPLSSSTYTLQVSLASPYHPVMVTVPAFFPVTLPVEETVAIEVSEEANSRPDELPDGP